MINFTVFLVNYCVIIKNNFIEEISFFQYCESKPGKMRKFCLENLDSYLDKVSFLHE